MVLLLVLKLSVGYDFDGNRLGGDIFSDEEELEVAKEELECDNDE